MIEVPVIVWHTISVNGSAEREVRCEWCHREFIYVVEREATGTIPSPFDILTDRYVQKLATGLANKRLTKALQTPDLVACPDCGWLQSHMLSHANRFLRVGYMLAFGMAILVIVLGIAMPALLAKSATIAGIAATVGFVLFAWTAIRNPNFGMGEVERKARGAASRAMLKDQYFAHQAEQARVAVAREQEAIARGPAAFAELMQIDHGAALKRGRENAKAQSLLATRKKWSLLLSLAAVAVGCVVGVWLDVTWFGDPAGNRWDRTVGGALGALFGGIAGLIVPGLADSFGFHYASVGVLNAAVAATLLGSFVAATVFGTGFEGPTLHGACAVIAGESLVVLVLWSVMSPWHNQPPV